MARLDEMQIVAELVGITNLSAPKIAFAIDEAAEYILRYTNRACLPPELERLKLRMAADLLAYIFPRSNDAGDPSLGDVSKIVMDDVTVEADGGATARASAAQLKCFRDYDKQLQMWRVVPRYRRRYFEPRQTQEF